MLDGSCLSNQYMLFEFGVQSKKRSMEFIINTVSAKHSLGPLLELLKVDGTLVIVGAPDKPMDLPSFPLIFGKFI